MNQCIKQLITFHHDSIIIIRLDKMYRVHFLLGKTFTFFCVSYAILILARKSRIIRIAIAELTNKVSTNTKMAEELLGGL